MIPVVMTAYFLSFFAYMFSYVSRKAFSVCMSGICLSLSMTKSFAGTISTAYLACYGAGQFVNGLLSDKSSPRKMIAIGLTGAGLCNVCMGFLSSCYAMLLVWGLNGFFNSMMWSSVVKTLANWVSDEKREACATAITTSMALGTIANYIIASVCLRYMSWRATFWFCGGIVLLYALTWIMGTHLVGKYIDEMEQRAAMLVRTTAGRSETGRSMSLVSCILATGLVFTIVGILFNGIIKDGVTEWVPTYFTEYYGLSGSLSSLVSIVLPLVSIMGSYTARFINRKADNEMFTSGVMFTVCFISILVLKLSGSSSPVLGALCLGIAVMTMHGVNNMFLTIMPLNFAKVGRSSSVSGVLNASSYAAAAISSVLIGIIAENAGWNVTVVFWSCVAAAGLVLCFIGAPVWHRGKKKIG